MTWVSARPKARGRDRDGPAADSLASDSYIEQRFYAARQDLDPFPFRSRGGPGVTVPREFVLGLGGLAVKSRPLVPQDSMSEE